MDTSEKIIYSSSLGTVTDATVTLNYKSGPEEIPIWLITSVNLKHVRNYFYSLGSIVAIFLLIVPILVNQYVPGFLMIFSVVATLFFILSGIANWIGHHNLIVGVSNRDKKPLKVEMAKTKEGRQFTEAIRKSMSSK
jgi:hypothetical protein